MSLPHRFVIALCFLPLALPGTTRSEEVYREENGNTVREFVTRRTVPVAPVEMVQEQKTVLTDQYVTEMRDAYRTVYTPITEYRAEPRWHNWWNPFGRPYVAYHMRPRTHWEVRQERVQTPVTYRALVPETRTVMTPQRRLGWVEEQVVRREIIPPQRSRIASRPSVSARPSREFGAVRIASDPPRHSTALD